MKILTVVGARPQFVKAAVVSREINRRSDISESIVHTGQHYDRNMSDIFFEEMEIPRPKYNLEINSLGHGAMTGKMVAAIEELLILEKPDALLVYGDTNSTLAGALAASKLHIPIAHVEAGLRSFNRRMPEEINRILTDQVSDLLFCPTQQAIKNLQDEGFALRKEARIINSGDVMLDASLYYAARSIPPSKVMNMRKKSKYALCTIHRQENTDVPGNLEEIFGALNELSNEMDIILPLHPRTKKFIQDRIKIAKLIVIDPVSYFEMIGLIKESDIILTDSGGLQKEAYFFKKGCITLRDQTEWVETLSLGTNKLTGANKKSILQAYHELQTNKPNFENPYFGEGNSAEIIVNSLLSR